MAAIAAGGFAAGIYTTNEPPACKYIVDHCKARVIVVEGQKQLDKILAIRGSLPKLAAIVVYGGDFDKSANDGVGAGQAKVYSWNDFMALGAGVAEADLDARVADQKPGHCCTLIYTSGTTGNPKAVMISHDNVTFTTRANIEHHPDFVSGPLRVVSYLPLSHIAAQIVDIHSPMAYLADHGLPSEIHFAAPDAMKGSLKGTLMKAKPTVFFAVPRVWEKFAEAIQAKGREIKGLKKKISAWGKGTLGKAHAAAQVNSKGSAPFFTFLARKLVSAKAKAAIGLEEARLCLSGAAPITKDTLDYFGSLGVHIMEVYGMSENTGPQTCGQARSISHWFPYDPVRVVNADPP
jgi:long-chain-fatty-acid--CoA ligase ACSBG